MRVDLTSTSPPTAPLSAQPRPRAMLSLLARPRRSARIPGPPTGLDPRGHCGWTSGFCLGRDSAIKGAGKRGRRFALNAMHAGWSWRAVSANPTDTRPTRHEYTGDSDTAPHVRFPSGCALVELLVPVRYSCIPQPAQFTSPTSRHARAAELTLHSSGP